MPRPLRLGHIDLSFHAASAAVVQAILQRDGHAVELNTASHEKMFERYGRDEVDLLVSAWLPASHGNYLAPHRHKTRTLGVLYRPYCLWGVPEYVPENLVWQVSDLLKPEALAHMERRIQGINPGAGISRFSAAMVQAYALEEAGYRFCPGTEAECFDRYEQAVHDGRWVVIPLWHPHYLHHRYRIRALHEPKQLLGGIDDATLIVRREAEASICPNTLQVLAQLQLGNDVVTMLDDRIRKEGCPPLQAANDWLNSSGPGASPD
jgi:glycine betaine/proline transport system substrate-binding protein